MKQSFRAPHLEIAACILFLWMFVFFGAGLKMISLSTKELQYGVLQGMGYGTMAMLCIYSALGLIYRKRYGFMMGNLIFLAAILCVYAGIVIPSILKLPTVFMGTIGVFLLFWGRREFFYHRI